MSWLVFTGKHLEKRSNMVRCVIRYHFTIQKCEESLNTLLKPSVKGYPEILQVLTYLNNQIQITKTYCDYNAKLQYIQPNLQWNNNTRRTKKIIWFNTPFNLNVKTNVAKVFLQLIDTYFPPANNLHKIIQLQHCLSQLQLHSKYITNCNET